MTQFGRGSAQLTAVSETFKKKKVPLCFIFYMFVLEKHLDLVNVATVAALLINEFWIFKFPQ